MTEKSSNLMIHFLICHRDAKMAVESLKSLHKYSEIPLDFLIHDDGSLTSEDRDNLLMQGKKTSIISRKEADEYMEENLKSYPNCYQYRKEHIYALKLLDIAFMSDKDFGYCDSDILFLRPFNNLFEWPDSKTSAMFMQDYSDSYSMLPWTLLGSKKPKLASRVNAGLIFFRKENYDLDFIEWFLGQSNFRHKVGWLEQTCWAALGHRVGCRQWSPEQIVLVRPWTKDSPQLVAGHFVKESRYRMGEFLAESEQRVNPNSVAVDSFIPRDCNLFQLGLVHLNRQLKRAKNYHKIFSIFSRRKVEV
jgi:hypothetical protein